MRILRHRSVAAFGLLVCAAAASAATPIPVTVCDTVIGPRQQGVLMADLSCSYSTGVILQRGATLDLNGHQIDTHGYAVRGEFDRSGRITVVGPGQMTGGCEWAIITSGEGDRHRIVARDLDVVGCTNGIGGSTVRVDDVSVTGSSQGAGIYGDFGVRGRNVVASGNGTYGVLVPTGRARIWNLTANGNGWQGVLAAKTSLRDSTVTGNDAAGFTIDIGTTSQPQLVNVTCGLSAHEPSLAHVAGPPWGVCTND